MKSMEHPKLRDSKRLLVHEPYPLNEFPENVIKNIGRQLIFLLCIGRTDISGNDWGDVFAKAIGGNHLQSSLGIADVEFDKMAWSMKTVKYSNPHQLDKHIRLISGRCSPDFSYGITDPHEDIQKTGRCVLNIWNERVNIAGDYYSQVRNCILVRSDDLLTYTLFEEKNHRFATNAYRWIENKNGNLIGVNKKTGENCFTWQPHGSQFTIHTKVPSKTIKFKIKCPPVLNVEHTLKQINYDDSWVEIV